MFENIGGKCKTAAVVVCVLGMIGSVIGGLAGMRASVLAGIITIAVGCLGSRLGSIGLYAIGETADIVTGMQRDMLALKSRIRDLSDTSGALVSAGKGGGVQAAELLMKDFRWRCSRGRINQPYESSCSACGRNKFEALHPGVSGGQEQNAEGKP